MDTLPHDKRLEKFILRLQDMIGNLQEHSRNFHIHQQIDQFYYMRNKEEMRMLNEKLEEASERSESVREMVESKYNEVYYRWRKDVRWLNTYLLKASQERAAKNTCLCVYDCTCLR